jgi:hypothetical protein
VTQSALLSGATDCPRPAAPASVDGPSNKAEPVETAEDAGVDVALVRYPRPEGEGDPWSQWGQGLVLPDRRFVSAMGDHRGPDGDSYLFVYDPETQRLTRFADVLSLVEHDPGAWGYGKIHGQIVAGPCGEAYFSTYWGDQSDEMYTSTYRGDLLFRLDARLEPKPLGVPVAEHGIPSLAAFAPDGLVYGEATDPKRFDEQLEDDHGTFFVYDIQRDEVVFRSDEAAHIGFRSILVDKKGRAYLAARDGRLLVWEPGSKELRVHDATLPGGGWLRASTRPAPDGTVYGVTREPNEFFALRRDGSIRSLGSARGYTTSLALTPDGSRVFYVPGAHGDAWEQGTPVVAVDTKTGEQEVIVELNDLAEEQLGLTLGGSYNVVLDPSGDRLYVGLNAGKDRDEPWGEVVLAVIDLSP